MGPSDIANIVSIIKNSKGMWDVRMLTAGCKAFSLANGMGTGTNDWVIRSLDD
jgi:hypothetical protein